MNDLDRLRMEYANRKLRYANSDIYSLFNQAYLFTIQQRQRNTLALFRKYGLYSLDKKRVLELGCGSGSVLREYLTYGVQPKCLYGFDLLFDSVVRAHSHLSHLPLVCADGQHTPYANSSFDIVLQYTAFSSILDSTVKTNLAHEMFRVLRKPNGTILWYDFWLNPTNPQTKGIRAKEIHSLFPGCVFDLRRITLAPPIARRLVPISWLLSVFLEKLTVFNTHYLVAIRPKPSE